MSSPRHEKRKETAIKVIESADKLFHTQGFSNTTIRDIASDCGVSVGTVMSVGDKNRLLVASFDQHILRIHQERSSLSAPVSSQAEIINFTAKLFDPFLDLFSANPTLARAYGSILIMGNTESIVFSELSTMLIDEIHQALGTQNSVLAEAIYSAYLGLLFTWPGSEKNAETDIGELKRRLHQIIKAIYIGA